MTSETPLGEVIAANVKAQRVRMRLKQADVAARMQGFGLRWHYQTVGAVERGERPLTAEELCWLAICLRTIPPVLTQPPFEVVMSPSGLSIPAQRLSAIDDSVIFDGNVPKVSAAPGRMPLPERRIAEMEHLAEGLMHLARDVRRQAHREPQEDPQESGDAEDIPPRRPGRGRGRRSG